MQYDDDGTRAREHTRWKMFIVQHDSPSTRRNTGMHSYHASTNNRQSHTCQRYHVHATVMTQTLRNMSRRQTPTSIRAHRCSSARTMSRRDPCLCRLKGNRRAQPSMETEFASARCRHRATSRARSRATTYHNDFETRWHMFTTPTHAPDAYLPPCCTPSCL